MTERNRLTDIEMARLLAAEFPPETADDSAPRARVLALLDRLDGQQKAELFTRRECQPGEVILREDDPGDSMYLVASGRVLVYKGELDQPLILGYRAPGSILGEMALLENMPRSATVVAMEDTLLLGLPRERFFSLLGPIPELSQAIMGTFSARLRQSDDRRLRAASLRQQTEAAIRALREEAARDPLTGLYNRRRMDEELPALLAAAGGEGAPVCVMMMDIDFFKKVNDTYGHPAGDRVLRALADLLRQHIRADDLPCRYGGEEFLVVLPGVPLHVALERAEHLRAAFAGLCIPDTVGEIRATLSLGVAAYPQQGERIADLIAAADQALYRAKREGRNRVICAL